MNESLTRNRFEELVEDWGVVVGKKEIDEPRYFEYNTTLYDVYTTCSKAKRDAFDYCVKMKEAFGGYGGRIAAHCVNFFSYDFRFKVEEREYLMHITKKYNRAYMIKENAE